MKPAGKDKDYINIYNNITSIQLAFALLSWKVILIESKILL